MSSLRVFLLPGLLAASGCFVSPSEQTHGQVALSLGLDWDLRIDTEPTFNPWDGLGLFRLELFPKYLRVAVELEDYELTSGSWPDPARGIGDDESNDGEVVLELAVPAGKQRRIRALGFNVKYTGEVTVYKEAQPLEVELSAGQLLETNIDMVEHSHGSVAATVRCKVGNVAGWAPTTISAVDARAQVVYPPVALEPGSFDALSAELKLPIGRPHWARIKLREKDSEAETFIDIRKPTFTVTKEGETLPVVLTIPCGL